MSLLGMPRVGFKHKVEGVWQSRSQGELLETPRKDLAREAAPTANPLFSKDCGYEEAGSFCLLVLLLLCGGNLKAVLFRTETRDGPEEFLPPAA